MYGEFGFAQLAAESGYRAGKKALRLPGRIVCAALARGRTRGKSCSLVLVRISVSPRRSVLLARARALSRTFLGVCSLTPNSRIESLLTEFLGVN